MFGGFGLDMKKCGYFGSILMKPTAYIACWMALALGGCSLLPRAGPAASEVAAAGQADNEVLFDVVEVDNRVVSTLLAQPKESFHARFARDQQPPELKIAVGDIISVTIWERAAGGLFGVAPPQQLLTGSRPETEPLAPESPQPPPETPPAPIPGIDQLLGPPNQPPEAAPQTPFGAPNQPLGVPSETPAPVGQPPSGNIRQPAPLAIEATASADRRGATIPDQPVAGDGTIDVPYAGRVPAAGRTPAEVQRAIEALLANKALGPQALVIVKRSDANAVTVAGEVVAGARVPLSPGCGGLLQVIAAAGGINTLAAAGGTTASAAAGGTTISGAMSGVAAPVAAGGGALLAAASGGTAAAAAASGTMITGATTGVTAPVYEIFVRLSRHSVTVTIPLERLVAEPAENIYARPATCSPWFGCRKPSACSGPLAEMTRSHSTPRS